MTTEDMTYEAPRVRDIGRLTDLTAGDKARDLVPALGKRTGYTRSDTTHGSGPVTSSNSHSW